MNKLSKIFTSVIFTLIVVVTSLPSVTYASNENQSKIEYTMKKDKITIKDNNGNVKGIIFFQYPQFKGDSTSITKINKELKLESKKILESDATNSLKEYTKYAIDNNAFSDDKIQYFYKTSCKATYNKNNIVSFHMKEEWYAGGVSNQYDYGLNYNIRTGEKLTIDNVISGNSKEKILAAAKKKYKSDKYAYDTISNTKNYKFYFGKGKVYICYGSYELNHGISHDIFSVTGKHK